MPLKIVRNDITKMHTDIIVNTANTYPEAGSGCDYAIYQAAGYDKLLRYRREKIGEVPEGEVFFTPGFSLDCSYIIHAVSPRYLDGEHGEEEKLRACYRKSLNLAQELHGRTIAFPLISAGGFGYPKEEAFRIAVDEIYAFILHKDMTVYLVVFGDKETGLGSRIYPDLESYIDQRYVEKRQQEEYFFPSAARREASIQMRVGKRREGIERCDENTRFLNKPHFFDRKAQILQEEEQKPDFEECLISFDQEHESALEERMHHMTDTFSEYLIYLIDSRGMTYPEVYKRALIDKKAFSKIKNNPNAHPKKMTAMCLCVGAKLNLDQTRDLLARAGYALSPCDKTDIIFSYFIEKQIYDMIELDIQLEEHGLPCLIS